MVWPRTPRRVLAISVAVAVVVSAVGVAAVAYGLPRTISQTGFIPNVSGITDMAFDSRNGDLYASMAADNYLTIASPGTSSVLERLPIERTPPDQTPGWGWSDAIVFDSAHGYVFVADVPNITVIEGLDRILGTIPVWASALAFDPQTDVVYAVGPNVTAIQSNPNGIDPVLATIPVGGDTAAYDSANGNLYVGGEARSLTVIRTSSNTVVGTIPLLAGNVDGIAVDPRNGDLYVPNADYVTVVDPTSGRMVANISTPYSMNFGPAGIVFDPFNGYLYVSTVGHGPFGGDNITVIDGATNTVVGGFDVPYEVAALAVDPNSGDVFAAGFNAAGIGILGPAETFLGAPLAWGYVLLGVVVPLAAGTVTYAVLRRRFLAKFLETVASAHGPAGGSSPKPPT